jgi:hypothetical protein
MVALDYFRRLGHDNHRRLSKLYAWEEKKSKTSWGAESVDYEKIAAAAVQAFQPCSHSGAVQSRYDTPSLPSPSGGSQTEKQNRHPQGRKNHDCATS